MLEDRDLAAVVELEFHRDQGVRAARDIVVDGARGLDGEVGAAVERGKKLVLV